MVISTKEFGTTAGGETVTAYTMENFNGMAVTVLDYGALMQSLLVPNAEDTLTDVVLGYECIADYEQKDGFLGATIGRVANRIGGARFSLNGEEYALAKNDGENHLHGGRKGFDKQMWKCEPGPGRLVFSRLSPDGEENYPGNLSVKVSFILTENNVLAITYEGVSDRDTLVNLTNHAYFNLNGGGSVLEHQLQIHAERFCEIDSSRLPTGKLLETAGSPFDFQMPKSIGKDIGADCGQLKLAGGYDHNFVLSGRRAAVLYSARTGIEMTVETDLPGMQLYTANGLTKRKGKGREMGPRGAVCLETQLFPNGMNCWSFPSPVLRAGAYFRTCTTYQFAVV